MKLRKFFRKVYRPRRQLSDKSVYLYERAINLLCRFLGRKAVLSDLNDETICEFIDFLYDYYESRYSVKKEIAIIKAIWNFGSRKNDPKTRRRYVAEGPDLPAIKTPELMPKAYSEYELQALISSCYRFDHYEYAGVPSHLWWTALHFLLIETGERIGAALQIEFSDLDGDVIRVRPETRKGGTKSNVKRLSERTLDLIDQIRTPIRSLIFPWDRSKPLIYRHYTEIRDAAGVYETGSGFHKLRKTLATFAHINGGDAKQILGHSSGATTDKHYLDKSVTADLESYKYLPKLAV